MNVHELLYYRSLIKEVLKYKIELEESQKNHNEEHLTKENNIDNLLVEVDMNNNEFDIFTAKNLEYKLSRKEKYNELEVKFLIDSIVQYQKELTYTWCDELNVDIKQKSNNIFKCSELEQVIFLLKNQNLKINFINVDSNYPLLSDINVFENNKILSKKHLKSVAYEQYIKSRKKKSNIKYFKWEIILVEFGDTVGSEFAYKHPAVVLNYYKERLTVLPITSKVLKYNENYNVLLKKKDVKGISLDSMILLDQLKSISKERVLATKHIRLPKFIIEEIESKLLDVLGI